MEQLKHLIENQAKWAQMYNDQQKEAHLERLKKNRASDWYGNSKEYRNEWGRQNKRKAVRQASNVPTF